MFRSSQRKTDPENRHTIHNDNDLRVNIDQLHIEQSATVNTNNFIDDYDENFVSPSVRVRHSITYEYDEKQFEIIKGELLFLINKTNHDWWLCLRLDENQTFFVPASYLKELEIRPQPNLVPPPRPPPPPPANTTPNSTLRASQRSNAALQTAARAATVDTSPAYVDYSNENIAGAFKKPEIKQRQLLNYSRTLSGLAHSSDELQKVHNSKIYSENLTDDSADSVINDLDECLNKEEEMDKRRDSEEIYTTVASFRKSNETKTNCKEEDNHIYENYPVPNPRPNNFPNNRRALIEQRTSISNDEFDDELYSECDDVYKAKVEQQRKSESISSSQINEDLEAYLHEEEENSKSEDDILELEAIKAPVGWKIAGDSQRRYCYNDFNEDKWFITQDKHGKHYFYNAEGKSVWELCELISEDASQTDNAHFRKNFDGDLGTFNVLHNRLSVRKVSSESSKSLVGSGIYPSLASPTEDQTKVTKSNKQSPSTPLQSHRVSTGLTTVFKCVRLAEKGKKCKKKTVENYRVELASTNLLFIGTKGGVDKLELPIDFKGGKCFRVEIPKSGDKDTNNNPNKNEKIKLQLKLGRKDKDIEELAEFIGSTKNGFVIETLTGYKILLIHESGSIVVDWVTEINLIISQNKSTCTPLGYTPESSTSFESAKIQPSDLRTRSNPSYVGSKKDTEETSRSKDSNVENKTDYFKNMKSFLGFNRYSLKANEVFFDKRKYSTDSLVINNFVELDGKYTNMPSSPLILPPLPQKPPPKSDDTMSLLFRNNVIKSFLSSFLKRRPSYTHLKNEGIIKECVYGANLLNLCHRERKIVPLFVEDITAEIERKGLDMDGIYRISGNLAEVQKVRHQVDQAIADKITRLESIYELIRRMPIPHRETMRHLCQHLLKVVEQSSQNRMTVQNVALVFGPNLIRSNPINEANNGFNPHIMTQNVLVEYILKNFHELYSYTPTAIFYEES